MFKHILISTDGSPLAKKAAKAGIALAHALGPSNIANADTPNYQAVDIDIPEVLRRTRSVSASANMITTNSRHLQGQAPRTILPSA